MPWQDEDQKRSIFYSWKFSMLLVILGPVSVRSGFVDAAYEINFMMCAGSFHESGHYSHGGISGWGSFEGMSVDAIHHGLDIPHLYQFFTIHGEGAFLIWKAKGRSTWSGIKNASIHFGVHKLWRFSLVVQHFSSTWQVEEGSLTVYLDMSCARQGL